MQKRNLNRGVEKPLHSHRCGVSGSALPNLGLLGIPKFIGMRLWCPSMDVKHLRRSVLYYRKCIDVLVKTEANTGCVEQQVGGLGALGKSEKAEEHTKPRLTDGKMLLQANYP